MQLAINRWMTGLAIASLALPSVALSAPSSDVQRALKASSIDDYGFKQKLLACYSTDLSLARMFKLPKPYSMFVKGSKVKLFNNMILDYFDYVLKATKPSSVNALMKDELVVTLNNDFAGLLALEDEASQNKVFDTCRDTYSKFMAQAPALTEKAKNSSKKLDLPKSSSTSKDNHSQCLEARDYEGCMRVKSSGGITAPVADWCHEDGSVSVCVVKTKGNDSFGLPKPMGWMYTPDEGSRIMYFTKSYRVPHKGQPNRYVGVKRITRYYQNPDAGTSGTFIGGGNSYTDCVGSGSSLNCSTRGGDAKYIPGRKATPGGVRHARFDSVYDCKDNTYASYKGSRNMSGGWVKNSNDGFAKYLKTNAEKVKIIS